MVPSSYVEQIEEEPSAYQDVPDDDSDFSSEGGPNGSGKFFHLSIRQCTARYNNVQIFKNQVFCKIITF